MENPGAGSVNCRLGLKREGHREILGTSLPEYCLGRCPKGHGVPIKGKRQGLAKQERGIGAKAVVPRLTQPTGNGGAPAEGTQWSGSCLNRWRCLWVLGNQAENPPPSVAGPVRGPGGPCFDRPASTTGIRACKGATRGCGTGHRAQACRDRSTLPCSTNEARHLPKGGLAGGEPGAQGDSSVALTVGAAAAASYRSKA